MREVVSEITIKVLKLGNKFRTKITCDNCGSLLEFNIDDCELNEDESILKSGVNEIIKTFSKEYLILKCPICDNDILVKNLN